jgi:two-component system, NtrC family, response regulator PilR
MDKGQRAIRVLVVDDDEDLCWALCQIIEGDGLRCVSVNTAADALRAVAREDFRLAFVDVKLPDMNGFELVRCIHHRTPNLPCVLVSGFLYHDDDLVRDGLRSGLIVSFIGKPFLLSQIQDTLCHFVSNREPSAGGQRTGQW